MRCKVELSESDIKDIIGARFNVKPSAVTLHHTGEDRDGPYFTAASTSAVVECQPEAAAAYHRP